MLRALGRMLAAFMFAVIFLQASMQPAQAQLLDWTNDGTETTCVKTETLSGEYTIDGEVQEGSKEVDIATIQGIGCLIRNVLAVATTFIGLAAFVMLVMGAFLYLISGGQSKHTEAAKQTITYAIIGIVVALMAFFILNLIATFTGARGILRFDIFVESPGGAAGGGGGDEDDEEAAILAQCQADRARIVCNPGGASKVCDTSTGRSYCQGASTWRSLSPGQTCPNDEHLSLCRCFAPGSSTTYDTVNRNETCPPAP